METLPAYVEGRVPQSAFDALLTRTAARISSTHPDARVLLENFIESQKAPAYNALNSLEELPKPIACFPPPTTARKPGIWEPDPDPLTAVRQAFVVEFFKAIKREDSDHIALLIQHNIVTANTTDHNRGTPLSAAIWTGCIPIVKLLLELGADPDMFGTTIKPFKMITQTIISSETEIRGSPLRTPLMHAVSIGSLPIVKLLMKPPYCANDALVAPDGEIALRLASDNGHRAIVDYLPFRRAGHFLRFKYQNARNIAIARKRFWEIAHYVKVVLWEIPMLFLWTLPKHIFILPIARTCKKLWVSRHQIGPWFKRQLIEVPKKVWACLKSIPTTLVSCGKGLWRFGTITTPRWGKHIANWSWKLTTEHVPRATRAVVKWLWEGTKLLAQSISEVLLKTLSFLHTTLQAVVTFLRDVSLRDIRNALYDLALAAFITFPATLWQWIKKIEEAFYRAMVILFGATGWLLYGIMVLSIRAVLYIPKKLSAIFLALANTLGKAAREVTVWINPKA